MPNVLFLLGVSVPIRDGELALFIAGTVPAK